jgi:LmbE family N-acetylglucosaminyl deacetylase
MATTTLIVSPHLDDAVLSVGGSIAAWTAAGERVVIATVYTAGPALADVTPSMRKFADYRARCAEDAAALAVVGAEHRWLGQIERAFRPPFLTGWSFFTTPKDRAGFPTLDAVSRALDPLFEPAPDRILIPLGIGNHIDHVETLIAATGRAAAHGLLDRVWFYEDFYALSRLMRRHHPIAKHRQWKRWQSPLLRARRLGMILRSIGLARRGPDVTSYLAPPLRDATWTVEVSNIGPHEEHKLDAIACYVSQTRAFGGFAGIARAIRAYHTWWGGEPLWRATRGAG